MPAQPIKAIPPPEHPDPISPRQVWTHLDANQQQQICQTLITIINQLLTTIDIASTLEEMTNDNNASQQ